MGIQSNGGDDAQKGRVDNRMRRLEWLVMLLPAVLTTGYLLFTQWVDVTILKLGGGGISLIGGRGLVLGFYGLSILATIVVHHELRRQYEQTASRLWHPYLLPVCAAIVLTSVVVLPWVRAQLGMVVLMRAIPGAFLVSLFLSPIITGPIVVLGTQRSSRGPSQEFNSTS